MLKSKSLVDYQSAGSSLASDPKSFLVLDAQIGVLLFNSESSFASESSLVFVAQISGSRSLHAVLLLALAEQNN